MKKAKRSTTRRRTRKVKVALIGAGGMANTVHYPSLAEFEDVDIVGICDIIPDKLRATANRFGIKNRFADYREMLDTTKPRAAYALMPPHHLYDVAVDVLMRGHDLFVEKPPGVTTFQTECLARAAAKSKAVTGVGFQRRYHPLFVRCLKEVRKRGPVDQVVASFYKFQKPVEPHPYHRGAIDILTYDAIHALDMCRFFAGGKVRAVASDVRNVEVWHATSWNAVISFDNGVTAVFLANWRAGARRLALELHTAGCSAYANADGEAEICSDDKPERARRLTHTEAAGSEQMHVHQGFRAQARAFINAVKSRRQPHNSLADAVETMRLVEQVYGCTI